LWERVRKERIRNKNTPAYDCRLEKCIGMPRGSLRIAGRLHNLSRDKRVQRIRLWGPTILDVKKNLKEDPNRVQYSGKGNLHTIHRGQEKEWKMGKEVSRRGIFPLLKATGKGAARSLGGRVAYPKGKVPSKTGGV